MDFRERGMILQFSDAGEDSLRNLSEFGSKCVFMPVNVTIMRTYTW